MDKIQSKVADTILQKPMNITLGGCSYTVAPPSIGTIIEASKAIAQIPNIDLGKKDILKGVLREAKDLRQIADVAAVLILGARNINERVLTHSSGFLWWKKRVYRTKREVLAEKIYNEVSPMELSNSLTELILSLQIQDFFGITTFLTGINLTKPTKVVTKATASGQ